jgi:ABC-2 type transport system permease protein
MKDLSCESLVTSATQVLVFDSAFRTPHSALDKRMEATETIIAPFKYYRWLPYWAVLRTDIRQTLRSWVYRLWVIVTILAAGGFLLYRFGLHREAGLAQPAAVHTADLIRGIALGSLALIVVLSVSSISSERGTLADSVLSRGISRYQYFMAKWHARTLVIVTTFVILSTAMLTAFHFLLADDLTVAGCAAAVATLAVLLGAIVSIGVAVGATSNSTVVGITVLWILLYGSGILLSFLPSTYPTPEKALSRLPNILRGTYNLESLADWMFAGGVVGLSAGVIGLLVFSRRDV